MTWAEPVKDWREQDRRWGLPSDLQIERLAQQIDAAHARFRQKDGTAAWRKPEHRAIGLYGERHVARVLGLPMDLTVRPYGSRRKNLVLRDGTTVDVVTRQPLRDGSYPDLTRKTSGRRWKVDALVLVVWHGRHFEPEVPGFIYDQDLLRLGTPGTYRDGITNVVAPVGLLSPLRHLAARHDPGSPYAREGSDWLLSDLAAQREEAGEDGPEPETPTPTQPSLFDVASVPSAPAPYRDPWRS